MLQNNFDEKINLKMRSGTTDVLPVQYKSVISSNNDIIALCAGQCAMMGS